MEASYYVGIDIGKRQLDWHLNDAQSKPLKTGQSANTPKGIATMISRWKRAKICLEGLIVCFEHTGPYGLLLAAMLEKADIGYIIVSAARFNSPLVFAGESRTLLIPDAWLNTDGVSATSFSPAGCRRRRCWSCGVGFSGGRSW